MKNILTILILITYLSSFGQTFNYPALSSKETKIENFIPKNWTLLKLAKGDLNKDSLPDFAMVIQFKDTVSLVNSEKNSENEEYRDTVYAQPRMLLIGFFDKLSGQYNLVEKSTSFIMNHDDPNMEEPFDDLTIKKNVLSIRFNIFMNMGSWYMSTNSYKFRFQENAFKLIGADYNSTHRSSGEIENRSYNFLSKKVLIETGNASNSMLNATWRTFNFIDLKTFKTFIKPFTYEVENGFYI